MSITILDPTGRPDQGATVALSQRPVSLAGKRIALLDNGKRNSGPLLEFVGAEISRQHGTASVVLYRKPSSSTGLPPEMVAELKTSADVVITGTGD